MLTFNEKPQLVMDGLATIDMNTHNSRQINVPSLRYHTSLNVGRPFECAPNKIVTCIQCTMREKEELAEAILVAQGSHND